MGGALRRERDTRRVVQSVQDHKNTMAALGRATGSISGAGFVISTPKIKSNTNTTTLDFPGKGHINAGKSYTEHSSGKTKIRSNGIDQGTAGISGKHKGPKGAPSNMFYGED